MSLTVEWVASILLVIYFTNARFDTPRHNRSSTTRAQFRFAQISYVLSAVALFAVLATVLTTSPNVLKAFHVPGEMEPFLNGLSSPLLAALVMTTLLPQFPGLAQIDAGLLKYFQDMGHIPGAVKQLAGKLIQRSLKIDDESFQRMNDFLRDRMDQEKGVLPEDLNLDGSKPTGYKFTRMLHFHMRLQALRLDPRYEPFVNWHDADLAAAFKAVDEILTVADKFFPLSRAYDPNTSSKAFDQTLHELKKSFRLQIDSANVRLAELAARAVLLCERSENERRRRLEWLGLPEQETVGQLLPPDRVVAVLSMVFLALFFGATLLAKLDPKSALPTNRAFLMASMVATIYGVAIMGAILPKHRWHFALPGPQGRPVSAYLLSGVLSVAGAALVTLLFKVAMCFDPRSAMFFDVQRALRDFAISYPWLAMTFVATVLLASLCDDYFGRSVPGWLRWAEGAAAAAILAVTAVFVHSWLADIPRPDDRPLPSLKRALVFSAMVGFILGAWVPHWYRKARSAPAAATPRQREYGPPGPSGVAPAVR